MRKIILLLPLLTLAACTVGPDYKGPPNTASQAAARGTFVRASDPAYAPGPGLARWWESLGDPILDGLVDDALKHNPDIDLAQARIREAAAQLTSARAGELPSVSGNASYLHATLPGLDIASGSSGSDESGSSGDSTSNLDFYNLGLNASWEVDIFGGGRRGIEAARAGVGKGFADLADAQVSLSAQVAQAYVNLRDVQERARLNAQSSTLQRRALDLTRQRFAAGTASKLDVERLEGQLETTDAQAVPLQAQIDAYLNQLAVLTGREPGAVDALLKPLAPVPLPPASVPIGDPAALIASRPDIRSAERALAASTAQIGVNKAKLLPGIRFMGLLGLGGTDPGDIFDVGKLTALVSPMLSWNFLDFGKNKAAVRKSEAQRDEADAQYRQAVLRALQDAETSLSRFGNTRLQLAGMVRAQQAAERSAALNRQRVDAGTSSLIDQLDIERQRVQASIAVAQAKAQLTNDYVAVQKSLGLGWAPERPGDAAR